MGLIQDKQEKARGTNASNPNRGKLAAQLEASKASARLPEARQEPTLVVRLAPLLVDLGLSYDLMSVGLVPHEDSVLDPSKCLNAIDTFPSIAVP